ncbi:MAG: efflux RND transporter periplasmic adaptor subunit [Geminicoccaceae bacterium]
MRRALGLVLALLLIVAMAWFSCWRGTSVSVATAVRGDAAHVVYATGIVEPVHWAKIVALQRKRVVELCRCEGEPVKKGEILARLECLWADANRLARLVESNVSSRIAYEEALTQVREYEARRLAQQDRIEDLSLKSPIDGIVLRRGGEVGEIAGTAANEALLRVGQARPLRVVAEGNEHDITKVKQG